MKYIAKLFASIALFAAITSCTVEPKENTTRASEFNSLEEQVTYQRAFEAVIWSMPATAIHNLRKGFDALPGVDNNVIVAYSKPVLSKHKAITANTATPYITAFADLRNGPVVLEVPAISEKASLYGQVVDAWQSTIADVGPSGLDQGIGAKYLFLPPGVEMENPGDYIVVNSPSYRIFLVFRSIRGENATDADAYAYTQELKMYDFKDDSKPEPTKFVDGIPYPLQTLPEYDLSIFEDIHEIFSVEPVLERDKVMMGLLKSIGIEAGKPFAPSERTQQILEKAAKDANAYMHNLVAKHHEKGRYWDNRNWSFVMLTDEYNGFDFVNSLMIDIDMRAAAWNFFTLYPKKLSENPATVYLAPIGDKNGNKLEAGRLYKITIPANIPAKQFWSITVYDEATWAFIDNDMGRSGLGKFNIPDMAVNEDGSVDVFFGPEAPENLESNWVPTSDKVPYVWLRLYGPDIAFWDKSFIMPDIERVIE